MTSNQFLHSALAVALGLAAVARAAPGNNNMMMMTQRTC